MRRTSIPTRPQYVPVPVREAWPMWKTKLTELTYEDSAVRFLAVWDTPLILPKETHDQASHAL